MTAFDVKQGDVSFEARFVVPAFMLLSQSHLELHPNMLLHLGKYGLTLNDIRIETGIPNLAGANVIYGMNALNAAVRVWLDRIEIAFGDLTRVTEEQIIEVGGAALEALRQTVSNIPIETYTGRLTMHGTFQDVSLPEFIARYVKRAPKSLGSVLGSGVVYYLGPEAERRSASLIIDMSTVLSDAAMIRTTVILDGTKLAIADASAMTRDTLFKMHEAINLEVNWGD